jgi:hypothetical protein
LALHMVVLGSCSAMETHFTKLPANSYCADLASRGCSCSAVSVQTKDIWFLSTQRSRSVSLCGLPLCDVTYNFAVEPLLFHVTITALTVEQGSSSRTEIWRTDLLERWHPMTVPRWKSLISSVRLFYCQCLSMEIARLRAQFYTPVSNLCGWNSRIH